MFPPDTTFFLAVIEYLRLCVAYGYPIPKRILVSKETFRRIVDEEGLPLSGGEILQVNTPYATVYIEENEGING